MGTPIRSRLLDYIEAEPPAEPSAGAVPASPPTPEPGRSRLLEYAAECAGTEAAQPGPPGPQPGVPAYHTPVFVPAHPRYADVTDADGRPTRVPFIAYELFEHQAAGAGTGTGTGTVAFAFTTRDRLVAALGDAQPWVATSIGPLAETVAEYDVTVLLDPRVAPGHHNWQPDDLAAYARQVR
ncbi:SAV_915 family protein [Streptomyces sp. NPDC050121]|uniref:SAV_915 family protein n=1 Tax=Streptomyces sp. NPDC050121 TaxID=3365601 RepID=UPI0037A74E64